MEKNAIPIINHEQKVIESSYWCCFFQRKNLLYFGLKNSENWKKKMLYKELMNDLCIELKFGRNVCMISETFLLSFNLLAQTVRWKKIECVIRFFVLIKFSNQYFYLIWFDFYIFVYFFFNIFVLSGSGRYPPAITNQLAQLKTKYFVNLFYYS